jgi:hypothetical protein
MIDSAPDFSPPETKRIHAMERPMTRKNIGPMGAPACAVICFAALGLLIGACASPGPRTVIKENPQGTVYLEPLPKGDEQATHPLALPDSTVRQVLRGVQVVGDKNAVENLFDSTLKPTPVFSETEVAFLTPLLVQALGQATPQQQVSFRVSHLVSPIAYQEREGAGVGSSQSAPYGPEPETTSGSLYAYGRSLYLTLSEYRHRPARPDAVNMPNRRLPDRTGLDRAKVVFTPEAAKRPDLFKQSSFFGDSEATTVVIDYQLLAKLPPVQTPQAAVPAPQPAQAQEKVEPKPAERAPAEAATPPAATAQELQSVKDLLIKKDMEMQEMKEELKAMKKQLADQDAERRPAAARKKKSPPSPVAPAP